MSAAEPGSLAERSCTIAREQSSIDDARRFAELALTYCEPACREAASMAVSEFAENLVKYSSSKRGMKAGTIAISAEGGRVRIRARNDVGAQDDAQAVLATISKLAASGTAKDLYRARLSELFSNPSLPRAQLGLLRIAFEGSFRLSCSYVAPVLEITAERPCGAAQ
jgi:hypothetical protein